MGSSPGISDYPPAPAYFRWLDVENVRCFGERQRLELTDGNRPAKWTVLLGDNGVGKTTLLQCLYFMAPAIHTEDGMEWCVGRGSLLNRELDHRAQSSGGSIRAEVEFGVPLTSHIPPRPHQAAWSDDEGVDYFMLEDDELPSSVLCCGYGASRSMGTGNIESQRNQDHGESLFETRVPLINAVEWLLQADYAARSSGSPRAIMRRNSVKRAIIDLLPDVDTIREAGLDEDPPRPRVEAHTPYGWVGMRDLSLGYQTMVAWVVDLAARMFETYTNSKTPLRESAVVLVDEIDLHLHPRWQREITSYLDRLFPNVQFIVTAHSPLVVQGAGVTNVAVLRRKGDEVEILNDPEAVRGWRVDQILTSDLFGLDSARPADIEKRLERQQELVLLEEPNAAEREELQALDQELSALTPGETARDREAWTLMRELATKLDKASGNES